MRITLKSNFEVAGIFEKGYIDMPGENVTLRNLLNNLSEITKGTMELISQKTNEVNPEDFFVSINDVEYPFLPGRLETKLKDGDVVDITITVLGGG